MNDIDETVYFSIQPDAVYTLIDNEAVIMGAKDDTLYGVNEVGTELLTCLESKPMSVRSLAEYLCSQFEVDIEQSMLDTKEFIQFMLSNHLMIQVN